jgi:hypothetical protein
MVSTRHHSDGSRESGPATELVTITHVPEDAD